jgi:hypothetical protein
VSFATARFQWEEGARYLAGFDGAELRAVERVSDRIVEDLRRRLGGPFRIEELVSLYRQGTDWTLDLASRTAPELPAAWDSRVADAAFLRFAREAQDYAGGRRLSPDDQD